MQITIAFKYEERYLPSRRHRIPHVREVDASATAEIAQLSLAEAPVAFRMHHRPLGGRPIDYHWHADKIYTHWKVSPYSGKPYRQARARDLRGPGPLYGWKPWPSHEDGEKAIHTWADQFRIIDGRICRETSEPRYVVMTFGLGHNHGLGWGTSLSVDDGFNPNIPTERYWRIDQEREANAAGWAIAQRRGDTKAKDHFKRRLYERFEIFISEAVRMQRNDRSDPVNDFSAKATTITEAGLPPVVAAFALFAAAIG